MHPCIEDGGSNPPLLESGSAGEASDSAAYDGDGRIAGERGGESDLLLREALLDDGPSRSAVRAPLLRLLSASTPLLAVHRASVQTGKGQG